MSKLKTLLAKYKEKREEKIIEIWLRSTGVITDPPDGCFCGCIVPLLFWVGIIGFAIYKLFF